jgi:iron complex transport system ATP-binding protein
VSSAAAATARDLSVRLGESRVVDRVDLRIASGRWTSIVGPNGAGKSSLMRALAQLLPSSGHLEIFGRDARRLRARDRARTLSWLGQGEQGPDEFRAYDVVMLGRSPHQAWLAGANSTDRQAVEQAMTRTQCWDLRERRLATLSGGERQRVLLARALAVGAPLLVMDEPLANLDPPHQADWLSWVREHVRRGGSVISVLHELTMAMHADDMVIIRQGAVVHHGACSAPATHRALERAFDSRVAIRDIEGTWVALPRA